LDSKFKTSGNGSLFLNSSQNLITSQRVSVRAMKGAVCESFPGQTTFTNSGVFRPNSFHAYTTVLDSANPPLRVVTIRRVTKLYGQKDVDLQPH
jgi:hypothetical protein